MRKIIVALVLLVTFVAGSSVSSFAATPKEQAFLDTYKKAFEEKDEATLKGFLYTKGADPMALEFFTMMLTSDMGNKISSIELKDLTPEDVKEATAVQPLPNGSNAKLLLTPVKKLVLKIQSADANGNSSSSSETFVAEADGKFWIPVPGPVK